MLVGVRSRGRVSCRCMARRTGSAGGFVCFTWMLLLAAQVEGQATCTTDADCNHYSVNRQGRCTPRANGLSYCNCKLATRKFGDLCQSACNITRDSAVCVNGVCGEEQDRGTLIRQCKCNAGWKKDTNELCRNSMCASPCQNGGSCVGRDQCQCTAGYMGSHCQMPLNCSLLPPPANGQVIEGSLMGVQRLEFECNKGFIEDGYTVLLCISGNWSYPPPKCKDIDECSPGRNNCIEQCGSCKNTIGSFTCERKPGMESYVYDPVSKRCQPTENVGSCIVLPSIVNGHISYSAVLLNTSHSLPDGTMASLKCHSGFTPYDMSRTVLKCADGKWSNVLSRCISLRMFCSVQLSVQDGDVLYKPGVRQDHRTLHNGTVAEVKCNDGYQVLDNQTTYAVCVDGYWNHRLTTCAKACKPLLFEQGMQLDYIPAVPAAFRGVPEGTAAKLRCTNQNRPLKQSRETVYCTNGAWSGELSKCTKAASVEPSPGAASSNDDATTIIVPVVILGIVLPALIVLFVFYYRSRAPEYKYSVSVEVKGALDQEDLQPPPSALTHQPTETVDSDGTAANNSNVHYASRDVAMGGKSPKPNGNIVATLTPASNSSTLEQPSLAPASDESASPTYHGYTAIKIESMKKNQIQGQSQKKPLEPPEYEDVARQEKAHDASQAPAGWSNSPPQAHQASVVIHNLSTEKKALKPVKKQSLPPDRSSFPIDATTIVMDEFCNGGTPVGVPCRTVSMATNASLHVDKERGGRADSKRNVQMS